MDEDLELTDVSVKQKSKLSRLRRAVLPVAASPSKSPSHKQDANSPAQQSTADQDGALDPVSGRSRGEDFTLAFLIGEATRKLQKLE